jgi:hypothetical protein
LLRVGLTRGYVQLQAQALTITIHRGDDMGTVPRDSHLSPTARRLRLFFSMLLALTLVLQVAPVLPVLAAGSDSLAAATPITTPLVNDITDTTSATRDAGEIGGGNGSCNFPLSGNTRSVWYSYDATSNGYLSVDTFGSSYDTVLEVFSGTAANFASLTSVACNDDTGGVEQSGLRIAVTAGTTYYIVARTYGVGTGGTLNFSADFSTNHEIYVDQVNGKASNLGTASSPVKTLQQGVDLALASGSKIIVLSSGLFAETVTINKNITLEASAGAVQANQFVLQSGAVVAVTGAQAITASTVIVHPGAVVQQGISLVAANGTVQLANGSFNEAITVGKNLTLRAVTPGSATISAATGDTITLTAGAVTVTGLNIGSSAGYSVAVTGGTGHSIMRNNITGNTGVNNTTATSLNARENYWGAATGPTHVSNPAGTGRSISDNVAYRPWCTTAIPTCDPLAGNADRLVFSTQPSDSTGGIAFPTQPVVQVQDAEGNIDTSYSGNVTIAIDNNAGPGGVLGGTLTIPVVNGVASFTGLSINKIGTGYTLIATSTGLTSATSDPFDITLGPIAGLQFVTQPTSTEASQVITPSPVVAAVDAGNNVVTTFNGSVSIAIGVNPGGGTLSGTTTITATNGVATFSNLSINSAGVGYTLVATISSPSASATSALFDITAGPATQLVFSTQPSDSTGGVAFPTQPVVEVQDAGGNRVTSFSGSVSLTIGTNPSGGTLSGTTTVNVVNGLATFSGLSINTAGTGYTLTAASDTLTSATSNSFNITVGPIAQLVFNPSPSNSSAGAVFPTQPIVELRDAGGNLVNTATDNVVLSIASGPGTTINGTTTVTASGGYATFSGLSIDTTGTYTLRATVGSVNGTSASFIIGPAAASALRFQVQPSNTQADASITPAVKVEAIDMFGNVVSSYTGAISVAIDNNPGTGTLAGTLIDNAVSGVATFSDLSINEVGTGYTLEATAAGLTAVTSNAFNITQKSATITLSDLSHVYDGNPHGATATTNPAGLNVTFTYNGSATEPTAVGSYTVVATINDALYAGTATGTLVISKATVSSIVLSNLNQTYDGTPRDVTATTTPAGLSVVFSYSGSGYGPSATAPTNAGTYNVTATINDPNYQGSTTGTLVVAKATATITITDLVFDYDGNQHVPTVTTVPADLAYTITFNGSVRPPIDAGSYAVEVVINDANYQGTQTATLIINKINQTITFNALPNKVYGEAPFTISATASSGLPVSFTATGACTVSGNTVTITTGGTCTITANQAGDTNYNAAPAVSQTFTIARAAQTITFAEIADQSFANSPLTLNATASSGLAVSYTASGACTVSGNVVTFTGLGLCTITASQAGNSSYLPANDVTHTFEITKAEQTITFAPLPDRAITNPTFTVVATASSGLPVTLTASGTCTVSGTTVTLTGVGNCTITASQPGNETYHAATSVAHTFKVVEKFVVAMPMITNNLKPDLTASISLSTGTIKPGEAVQVNVTVTNNGNANAQGFWVDFYIQPSTAPTAPNQAWNRYCVLTPCYGIAWYVDEMIGPGQSITLTSTDDSFYAPNTRWRGFLPEATRDIYVYVDSWNPSVEYGAVDEHNEANNRAEMHFTRRQAPSIEQSVTPLPDTMPTRPVRP